jgi:hypothetical protein
MKNKFGLPTTYSEKFILSNVLISFFTTLVLAYVEDNGTLVSYGIKWDLCFYYQVNLEAKVKRLLIDVTNYF